MMKKKQKKIRYVYDPFVIFVLRARHDIPDSLLVF
jgi:hypothetical protein